MKYFVFILFLLFIGCEEKQTTINDFSVPTFSSNIKPAIGGVEYVTSSGVEGVTDQSGEFTYNLNDNITFKLGNIILGKLNTNTINSNNYLSLFDLLGFKEHNDKDPKYIVIWQFLFSLSSKIHEGVVFIPQQIRKILKEKLPSHININTINEKKLQKIITSKTMLHRNWVDRNIVTEYFYNPQNIWWQFEEGLVIDAEIKAYSINPKTDTKELLFTEKTLPSKYANQSAKFYPHLHELNSNTFYLYNLSGGYLSDVNYDGLIDRNITITKSKNIYNKYKIFNNNKNMIENTKEINLFFKGSWFNKHESLKITSTSNILYKYFTYSYCLNNIILCKDMSDTWSRGILTYDLNDDEKISTDDLYVFNPYLDWDKSSKKFNIQKYNNLQELSKNNEKAILFNTILFDLVFLSNFKSNEKAINFSLFNGFGDYIFLNQTNSIDIVDFTNYYIPNIMYSIDSFVESIDLDMYYRKEYRRKPEISKLLFADVTGVLQVYNAKDNKFGVTDRIYTNQNIYQSFFINGESEIIYLHESGITMIKPKGNQSKHVDYLNHTIPSEIKIAHFDLNDTDVKNSIILKYPERRAIFSISSGSNGLKVIRTFDTPFTAVSIRKRVAKLELILQKGYFENPKQAHFSKDRKTLYILSNQGVDIFDISLSGKSDIRVDQLESQQSINLSINNAKSFLLLDNNKFVFLTDDNKLQFYTLGENNTFIKVGHYLQLPNIFSNMKLSVDKNRLFLFADEEILTLDLDLLKYFIFYIENDLDKVAF